MSLVFQCKTLKYSSTSWRAVRRMVVKWLRLDLDGPRLSRALCEHDRKQKLKHLRDSSCVRTRSGMRMGAQTQAAFIREISQWALHWDWWSWWVGNRCQNICVTPLRHCREGWGGFQWKGFGECVPVELWLWFSTQSGFKRRKKGWWMGVEPECLHCNSILCLAAVWVQVCIHMFFQDTMSSIVLGSSDMHTHHYPTIVRCFGFVAACVVTCVVFCGLSVVSCARRLLCSSAASLAQPAYLDIRFGRQYTYSWAPVVTGDDGRGRGPKSLPCQELPLGEQAAAGPSVQASRLGALKTRP